MFQRASRIRQRLSLALESQELSPAPLPAIIAASKQQPATAIESAIKAGIEDFGENRVAEAGEKWPGIKSRHPQVRLHLIGPLQSNKVREALSIFDTIHTLDRPKLAQALADHYSNGARALPCYIQVNTGEEPQKSGVPPRDCDAFIAWCRDTLHLPVIGLMCIPPQHDHPAPHFAFLRDIARRNGLAGLSMGMSDDFEIAARLGATHVRIGRALFGDRAL